MDAPTPRRFPLIEHARTRGVFDHGNALVVGPTGSGKSSIGRQIIVDAVRRGEHETHVYLVPYPAHARQAESRFREDLRTASVAARLKTCVGDHSDPLHPEDADILVTTYELFSSLIRNPAFTPGRLVIDEFHLLADETRGWLLEGLIVRLKESKPPKSLCALSALVANARPLARWLGVPLVQLTGKRGSGTALLSYRVTPAIDRTLLGEIRNALSKDARVLVFCESHPASLQLAAALCPLARRFLRADERAALRQSLSGITETDLDARELLRTMADGTAFYHAGLSSHLQQTVIAAFQQRRIRILTSTPAMMASLPVDAEVVIVREVVRRELVRGRAHFVPVSSGELLNALGHAGGRGIALIRKGRLPADELTAVTDSITAGRAHAIDSTLPESFGALMHFILASCADRGRLNLHDLATAVGHTWWYRQHPARIAFDRPLKADIMEDIPSFRKVTRSTKLTDLWTVADGVAGEVESAGRTFAFSLRVTGMECSCQARTAAYRQETCLHLACAIHHLLFNMEAGDEARSRAVYAAAHRFRRTLDLGTKIRESVGLLRMWHLVEFVAGGFHATPGGTVAANTSLDLLLARTACDRMQNLHMTPEPEDVVSWAIEDYFGDPSVHARWTAAITAWMAGGTLSRRQWPVKDYLDFQLGLEQLGHVTALYAEQARLLGKTSIEHVCRTTHGCLEYGVPPEVLSLAALRLPHLEREHCLLLAHSRGVTTLHALAAADPESLVDDATPPELARQWVATARAIVDARHHVDELPPEQQPRGLDEFLAQYQVDTLAFEPADA